MKKLIILSIVAIFAAGCTSEWLDIYPPSSQNTGNFYQSESDFEQAVNAGYAQLRVVVTGNDIFLHQAEGRSDDAKGATEQLSTFDDSPISSKYQAMWGRIWSLIHKANAVLTYSEGISKTEMPNIESLRGEARFLRGIGYFYLVRFWGGMPLYTGVKTLEEVRKIPRTSIEETYDFIIKDFEAAAATIPTLNNGKATSWTAKAYLAKIHLYAKNYQEALDECNDVIESGQFEFLPNWFDIFKEKNDNGKHIIFQVQCQSGGLGHQNPLPTFYTYLDAAVFGHPEGIGGQYREYQFPGATSQIDVTNDAYDSFEENDIRRDWTIISESYTNRFKPINALFVGKFTLGAEAAFDFLDWGSNITLMRYTDVLLMKAECINEISGPTTEAVKIINDIRNRAGLLNLTNEQIADKEPFFVALVNERRHELMFEHQRWFDLNRWGIALETINTFLNKEYLEGSTVMQSYHALYPIPAEEMEKVGNVDIMWQNPGWPQ